MHKDGLTIKDEMNFGIGKGIETNIHLKGHIKLELFGPDGVLKDLRDEFNLVTTLGFHMVMDQLVASPGHVKPGWMEVGSGSGGSASSTKLATVITGGSGNRTACSSITATLAVLTCVCTFAAGYGTGAITECGLFNVVTADTAEMYLYKDFSVINKGALDSLVVTWTLTASV